MRAAQILRLANVAAAFAVALYAGSTLWYASVIWNPAAYGDFGLALGDFALPSTDSSWIVTGITPGYPAALAGIRLGDRVSTDVPVHDRLTLTSQIAPRPDEDVTLRVLQRGNSRALTLKARPLAPLSVLDATFLSLNTIAGSVFVVVGLLLVLLRPSRMTWGFCLAAVAIAGATFPHSSLYPISYVPTTWLVTTGVVEDILTAAGAVGFLIFCLRFPANQPIGWRKRVDDFTPYFVAALSAVFVTADLGRWFFIVPSGVTRGMWNTWLGSCIAIVTLGPAVLLMAYRDARGPQRARMKWVILGLTCTSAALAGIFLSWAGPLAGLPVWCLWVLSLLVVAFPLTVAYAVVRHRVIDVRFVINRSLTLGSSGAFVALAVVGIDWIFARKVPSSRVETATYFAVALGIGLTLNAVRRCISRLIDVMFFRERARAREKIDSIASVVRRASFKEDLYEPLTSGMARALGLSSAALFERAADGGFGRVSAEGWPPGALWHILSDDPLVARTDARPRVTEIDQFHWRARLLPPGVGRPAVMVPIVFGKRAPAVLLCGGHTNGTGLDPDDIRSVRRLAADAALVYGTSHGPNWEQGTFIAQREGG